MLRDCGQWSETESTTCTRRFTERQRTFWWKGPTQPSLTLTLVQLVAVEHSVWMQVAGAIESRWHEIVFSRHISICDILKLHCGRGLHWSGYPSSEYRWCVRGIEGLYDQSGNRGLPYRTTERKLSYSLLSGCEFVIALHTLFALFCMKWRHMTFYVDPWCWTWHAQLVIRCLVVGVFSEWVQLSKMMIDGLNPMVSLTHMQITCSQG